MLEPFFRFSPRRFIDEKVLDEQIRCQKRNQGFSDDFRIIPWGFSSRIGDQPFIAMHPRHCFLIAHGIFSKGVFGFLCRLIYTFLLLIRIDLLLLFQFFYRTIRQGWCYSDFVSVKLLTDIKFKQLTFHLHDMKGRHRRCTSSLACEVIPERNTRCSVRDGTHTYCIETPDWCPEISTSITLSYSFSVIFFFFQMEISAFKHNTSLELSSALSEVIFLAPSLSWMLIKNDIPTLWWVRISRHRSSDSLSL